MQWLYKIALVPLSIAFGIFTFVTTTGFISVIRSFFSQGFTKTLQLILWANFILTCYYACLLSPSSAWSHLPAAVYYKVLDYLALLNSHLTFWAAKSITTTTSTVQDDCYSGVNTTFVQQQPMIGSFVIPQQVSDRFYGSLINSSFSHTLSLTIGIFVYFGLVKLMDRIEKNTVPDKMPKDAKYIMDVFFEVIAHMKYYLGTFIWFRFFFVHAFGDDTSTAFSTYESLNLAYSHTLAFSMGIFAIKDYKSRLQTQSSIDISSRNHSVGNHHESTTISADSKVMIRYSLCSFLIVLFRLTWKILLDAYLPETKLYDIHNVAFIGLILFACLPSQELLPYFYLPFTTSVILVASILVDVFGLNWTALTNLPNSFTLVLGVAIGVVLMKSKIENVDKERKYLNRQLLSRKVRAKNYPKFNPNGWYRIGKASDVKRGDVLHVHALGREFAVFRGEDSGEITVTDAHCPHLGANLGESGVVQGDRLVCPFHGWEFEGKNGRCSKVPYTNNPIPDVAKIHVWPSIEYMDMIVMYYDAEKRPPPYELPPIELYDKGEMTYFGEFTEATTLHIQDVCENAADFAHFGVVHAKMGSLPIFNRFTYIKHETTWRVGEEKGGEPYLLEFDNVASVYSIFNDKEPLLPPRVKVDVKVPGPGGFFYFQFKTPLGLVLMMKSFLPHRTLETTMVDTIWVQKSVPKLLAWYLVREGRAAFNDDILLWNKKIYPARPILLKEDYGIKKLRNWYTQFYSKLENVENTAVGVCELDW